jgi:hypothetical protein
VGREDADERWDGTDERSVDRGEMCAGRVQCVTEGAACCAQEQLAWGVPADTAAAIPAQNDRRQAALAIRR